MSLGLIHRRPVHPWAALREAERAAARLGRQAAPARRMASGLAGWRPRLEAVETEDGFEITAEMPGVARGDLEVSVQEGVLTIKGARRFGRKIASAEQAADAEAIDVQSDAGAGEDAQAEKPQDENAVRFERRIRFNAEVDEDAIAARYVDGVLEVHVPKVAPPEPQVRTIPVEVG